MYKEKGLLTYFSRDFDAEDARRALRYDPETGEFFWAVRPALKIKVGDKAGNRNPEGYVTIKIGGRQVYSHRLAFLITVGEWPDRQVDHRNGDKSDNRWSNLRLASHSQNQMNKLRQSNNTSGYKGVSWRRTEKVWVAQIKANGTSEIIGRFPDKASAVAAYEARAVELHGEFARVA